MICIFLILCFCDALVLDVYENVAIYIVRSDEADGGVHVTCNPTKSSENLINTQQSVVFQGNRPLSARFSTQEVIRVAFECPWGDLQDGIGFKARPDTLNKSILE